VSIRTPGRRSLVAAVAIVATLGAAPAASADSTVPPAAPITVFTVEPAVGSSLLGTGSPIVATDPDVALTGGAGSVSMTVSGTHTFTAAIAAPTSETLALGHYDTTRLGDAAHAGLDISGDGHSCTQSTGSLDILQFTYDVGSGDVTAFAATYTQSCDGGPANVGELRWSSAIPYERFGSVRLDRTSDVHTVTFTAPEATTIDGIDAGGDTDAFEVTTDGCTGQSLAAGQSCTLAVVAHPTLRRGTYGIIDILESGAVLVGRVSLTVTGQESAEGGFSSLPPARLLDTRKKIGIATTTPIGAGRTVSLQVTGRGGVPSTGVMAAVLNLTVVKPTYGGYLTAYPSGQARPTASSINVQKGQVIANLVTVPVGLDGKVSIFNGAGATHLLADVSGYYRTDASTPSTTGGYGDYQPVSPWRAVDTRTAKWSSAPLKSGWALFTGIDYGPTVNSHIKAVAVNVTAVGAQSNGYFTAWDGGDSTLPATSTLNYTPGRVVPNMAIVPVSLYHDPDTGEDIPIIGIFNAGGPAHVLVDVVGVFDDNGFDYGLRLHAMTPTRIVDTRRHLGADPLVGGVAQTVTAPGSVVGVGTFALVTNTAAVKPANRCYFTLWSSDITPRPTVSNLNPAKGQTVANMTMTELGSGNRFDVFNSSGVSGAVIDVAGSLDLYPAALAPSGPKLSGRTLDMLSHHRSSTIGGLIPPR
jgi:hypothetical protein